MESLILFWDFGYPFKTQQLIMAVFGDFPEVTTVLFIVDQKYSTEFQKKNNTSNPITTKMILFLWKWKEEV